MNGIKFIINQVSGNVPRIHPHPTTRHGISMLSAQLRKESKQKGGRKCKVMHIGVDELRQLYQSGASILDLEERTGVSRNTIIRRLGDTFQPRRGRLSDGVLRRVAVLRKKGVPWMEVQKRCGHHRKTLYRAAKVRGFL